MKMTFKQFLNEVMGAMDVAKRTNLRFCQAVVDLDGSWYVDWQKYGKDEKRHTEGPMSESKAKMRANTIIMQNMIKKMTSEACLKEARNYFIFNWQEHDPLGPAHRNRYVELYDDAEGYSDKTNVIKFLLTALKHDHGGVASLVHKIIANCRKAGYDYPEFKAIEKSLNSGK